MGRVCVAGILDGESAGSERGERKVVVSPAGGERERCRKSFQEEILFFEVKLMDWEGFEQILQQQTPH